MISLLIKLSEKQLIPDFAIRYGIRTLLKKRLDSLVSNNPETNIQDKIDFIHKMNSSKIALVPELANKQHYEIPANFYKYCLGRHRKYSSCYWEDNTKNLDEAELLSLKLTTQHAKLTNGQNILELGCGWGSLTLWMAKKFPKSKITAVSNSSSQKTHILEQAKKRNLNNISIITEDMNKFNPKTRYDRIVSVEMIEHMRNHRQLFKKINTWLKPGGLFFMHIFVHKTQPYLFEVQDEDDWMSQYFFSGGMMPSEDLPLFFQEDLKIIDQWSWSGKQYEKTANAWLANIDSNKEKVMKTLEKIYGKDNSKKWFQRWRIFFMSCAELWGYRDGNEWKVVHYLFKK
jgi:cyclopropane-fatty-acyl-phospholipid synthase